MKNTIINHKKYSVQYRFNMVGNYYFVDKDGTEFLVDAEDVSIWVDEQNVKYHTDVDAAIAYAKNIALESEGIFWWKSKEKEIRNAYQF